MNTYPLIFACREVVVAKRYSAAIDIAGRAVLEQDGDTWTVYGVEPGGVVGCGDSPREAYDDFRAGLKSVLFDSVEFFPFDFGSFQEDAEAFMAQANPVALATWEEARAAIRGGVEINDAFASGLPRRTDAVKTGIRVLRLDQLNDQLPEVANVLVANENLQAAA